MSQMASKSLLIDRNSLASEAVPSQLMITVMWAEIVYVTPLMMAPKAPQLQLNLRLAKKSHISPQVRGDDCRFLFWTLSPGDHIANVAIKRTPSHRRRHCRINSRQRIKYLINCDLSSIPPPPHTATSPLPSPGHVNSWK
ncbi:hypothetical protein C8F04DRAFT_1236677 [Mycena alexandri]|uniref:Uncharacterized protein n=1 Tax=Mycena alexandri TaxID=1745969 RepID=A0AAD6WZA7_9AGAR|nr:hypothetical protein C8F04DRAFT_1236677 [Mycena alexandri]